VNKGKRKKDNVMVLGEKNSTQQPKLEYSFFILLD